MDWAVRLVAQIRAVRSEMNVPPGVQLPLSLTGLAADKTVWADTHGAAIRRLARLSEIRLLPAGDAVPGAVQLVQDEATVFLDLAGSIDVAAERARLGKEIDKLDKEIAKIDGKLGNPAFIAKADPAVIEENRERRAEAEAALTRLRQAIDRLAALA
jgi:valyl-tRNA synthetase